MYMKRYRELKEYINDQWNDYISARATTFIKENYSNSEFENERIPTIIARWLNDVEVTSVYTKIEKDNHVKLFVSVRADVGFKGREYGKNHNDIEDGNKYLYLHMVITSKFEDDFKDVKIVKVTRIDERDAYKSDGFSTKAFVPYMSEANLDAYATEFLNATCPEALREPIPLPLFEITEKLGLRVISMELSDGVFGKTFFLDNAQENMQAGTIVIDPKKGFMNSLGSRANTIIHECVHWYFHRKYFDLMRLFNPEITSITCMTVENDIRLLMVNTEDFKWMEWQANALAPRILMPAKTTLEFYNNVYPHNLHNCQGNEIRALEWTIDQVADHFEVSKVSAKIRLFQLGIKTAVGINNFLDGEKIDGYKHSNDQIGVSQTFHVDFKDAVRLSLTNQRLNEALKKKQVWYVDGVFAINNKKYIDRSSSLEGPKLTQYAREHMDECCLVFDVKKTYTRKFDDKFYSLCFMAKVNDDSLHVREFNEQDDSNVKVLADSIALADVIEDSIAIDCFITEHLFDNFDKFFIALLKFKNMDELSNNALAKATLLDNKTIANYINGNTTPANLKHALAICAGLCLEPKLSYTLISLCGLSFGGRHKEVDYAYKYLIDYCYEKGIEFWNKNLAALGFPDVTIP